MDSSAVKYASYEFGARNLAIGIALAIVAFAGIPETIAIMTIVRSLIELQSVIIALVAHTFDIGSAVSIVIFAIEIYVVKTMFGIVSSRKDF